MPLIKRESIRIRYKNCVLWNPPCAERKAGARALDGKLKLYGFNNLTKALSFNIYDIC